jgi:hypothetical protein
MKALKIIDSLASKRRGVGVRGGGNVGVYRLRLADGRFASTGRTGQNIKGKARNKVNYKNAVAGVRLDLDKRLRKTGRTKPNMRALGFPVIEGSNYADKSVKAFKVVQKAKLSGKKGMSERDVRSMINERNKRLKGSQTFGQNATAGSPGASFNAQASGTYKGVKWSANVNWNNRKLQAGIAALGAGAILKGGYELYNANRRGK